MATKTKAHITEIAYHPEAEGMGGLTLPATYEVTVVVGRRIPGTFEVEPTIYAVLALVGAMATGGGR